MCSPVSDKASRRAVLCGLLMVVILDTGGNFAILAYASVILKQSGVIVQPHLQAMSIPIIMLIGSIVSTFTVETFGRKVREAVGFVCRLMRCFIYFIAQCIIPNQRWSQALEFSWDTYIAVFVLCLCCAKVIFRSKVNIAGNVGNTYRKQNPKMIFFLCPVFYSTSRRSKFWVTWSNCITSSVYFFFFSRSSS